MQDLRITIVQADLVWENSVNNLSNFDRKLSELKEKTDLIVLPEMFSTGFSMNPQKCAEAMDGASMRWLSAKAKELKSVITGSLLITENKQYYNRLIMMYPDGSYRQYDKRHLFRLAGENEIYTAGNTKFVTEVNGWKICPLICYDLRFPVWSRNTYKKDSGYEYDCLVYVANWPARRSFVWKSLLVARAIENQAYVAGINRIGNDGNSIPHAGDSMVLDYKGKPICIIPENEESSKTIVLTKKELIEFRDQFTVGLDWDHFELKGN
jgi:omega-amidase